MLLKWSRTYSCKLLLEGFLTGEHVLNSHSDVDQIIGRVKMLTLWNKFICLKEHEWKKKNVWENTELNTFAEIKMPRENITEMKAEK